MGILNGQQCQRFIILGPDNYAGPARLEITDGDLSAVAETQVTISNVAPVVEADDDKTAEVGEILNFSGFLVDPGEGDTHNHRVGFLAMGVRRMGI